MIASLLKAFPVVFKTLAKLCGMPYILAQSAVPVCLAPNGTVATNGIVTLGTALPTTYSGGIWLRLPAGAAVGGLAGLYWAVMSSTTQGQVYTNFADPATQFIPYIPSGALVAAVGSNAAYTQTTAADVTLVNVTVPGGTMGNNGALRVQKEWAAPNNANAKSGTTKFGATLMHSETLASGLTYAAFVSIKNKGTQGRQNTSRTNGQLSSAVGGAAYTYTAVDTSVDVSHIETANSAAAIDYVILESLTIEVMPS